MDESNKVDKDHRKKPLTLVVGFQLGYSETLVVVGLRCTRKAGPYKQ